MWYSSATVIGASQGTLDSYVTEAFMSLPQLASFYYMDTSIPLAETYHSQLHERPQGFMALTGLGGLLLA